MLIDDINDVLGTFICPSNKAITFLYFSTDMHQSVISWINEEALLTPTYVNVMTQGKRYMTLKLCFKQINLWGLILFLLEC